MNKFKIGFLLGAMALSISAVAAFSGVMDLNQVKSEIAGRLAANESLDIILADAFAAKIPAGFLTEALVLTPGQDGASLMTAMVRAGYTENAAQAALLSAGADPVSVTKATASGDVGQPRDNTTSTRETVFSGSAGSTFSGGGGSGGSRS